ncbi:arginine--tRNA ligase, cytoplasmic [Bacillus rossius redtenbacheri]|uniref:arginine--tRNA ligase, cytoplasmic n=1 Tax=Bacillus rossius redtenbacheri TaxID=93214 RepID=UPI002FDD2DE5
MNKEILQFRERAEKAEAEIKLLHEEIQKLTTTLGAGDSDDAEDLTDLILENRKLKHRIAILKRAVESEQRARPQASDGRMKDVHRTLHELFSGAVAAAFPDLPEAPCPIVTSSFCDYQCNAAMPISQLLKAQGVKKPPRSVAEEIVARVEPSGLVERLEIAGPGFINIFLSRGYAVECLREVLLSGVRPPALETRLRVVVDFSSPNVAKEMHVGHLRSTIIGESMCRLLEFLGHDVVRVNHIGDWGTQFGMLIAHLQDMFPNYLKESPPIKDLQEFYRESKRRFDSDEEFKKRAYDCVVKLQSFEPDHIKAWQMICDESRKEFQKLYERLDVTLTEKGESFYQTRMVNVLKTYSDFIEVDENGRKVLFGGPSDPIPMILVKSDGGFTYDTSDLATIKYRIEEEKADWIIYVTDAGQAVHFDLLRNCAKKLGILDDSRVRVDHVVFGVVLGEDKKKFKTRSGETIRLAELLDEGLRRALDKLREKERDKVLGPDELRAAQEAVAYGCVKYADLAQNRVHDYVFSFDKMLDDKGNTAVYLLYAFTRIRSIARTAGLSADQVRAAAATVPVSLEHDKEWRLAKVLLRLPEVITRITKDLCMHHLCELTYDIATTFTEFYDKCYCVEKDSSGEIVKVNMGRILLAEATACVLKQCFDILGLKPVSRM